MRELVIQISGGREGAFLDRKNVSAKALGPECLTYRKAAKTRDGSEMSKAESTRQWSQGGDPGPARVSRTLQRCWLWCWESGRHPSILTEWCDLTCTVCSWGSVLSIQKLVRFPVRWHYFLFLNFSIIFCVRTCLSRETVALPEYRLKLWSSELIL